MKNKLMCMILALLLLMTGLTVATAEDAAPMRVISLAPAITEVIVDLGAADVLVGIDTYSVDVEGIPADLPTTGGMTDPDIEFLVALEPDLILVSGLSALVNFEPITALGIEVVAIPTSASIAGIYEDNLAIGRALGLEEAAFALNVDMAARIAAVVALTESLESLKTVYFEISAAPYLYSLGQGTFLDELITLAGGVNIFHDQEGWLSISEEAVIDANPDVILTSVDYVENAVDEILSRPGWESVTAVAQAQVYQVNADTTARANHRVALALEEIARLIHPELYE